MAIEELSVKNICLILSRYVANGSDEPISKNLPDKKPIRKLSKDELNQLMDSEGFEWLETLPANKLRSVAEAFIEGATESLEKKA